LRAVRTLILLLALSAIPNLASAGQMTVPLDIGVGPTANLITGPVFRDQPVHFGLRISTYAIIDRATRRKYRNRIPRKYREMADQQGDIRYNPLACCIPINLHISPAIPDTPFENTGVYGLTLKPIGLGVNLGDSSVGLQIGLGALLSYMYVHSKTIPSPTHFLRPGLEARAEFEVNFGGGGVSLGWASQLFPPQEVGGSILALGALDESIWHIGQAFLLFHVRKPVAVNM
jgi:hypothetical protein